MEKQEILTEIEKAAERTGLDVEDIMEMIPDMLESEYENAKQILQFFENKEFDKVSSVAHSLKGASSSYGFQGIADIAHDIEKNPEGGDGWSVEEKTKEILQKFEELQKILS